MQEVVENLRWANRSNYSIKLKFNIFLSLMSLTIKSRLFKNDSIKIQKILGYKILTYDFRILRYLFYETFLSNDYFFFTENKEPIIIDCGANIGLSVLFFKKIYPNAIIIAFEPNPNSFDLLKKNISQNSLTNVVVYNIGLSNVLGEIDFFISDNKGSLKGSINKERGGSNKISIKSEKLSSYINSKQIDLIKIDVEGAELLLIEDLYNFKNEINVSQFIIEYHHKISIESSKLSKFLDYFESMGYEYNMKTSFKKIKSFQDILIHFYKN